MSQISINSDALIAIIEQKRKIIQNKMNKRKESIVEKYMEHKVGFFWWARNKTKEEAEQEVSIWWMREMALSGNLSNLRKLDSLEELAKTAKKKSDGVVFLSKEDNYFIAKIGEEC